MSKIINFDSFNFQSILEQIGQLFVSGLKSRIEQQIGIDSKTYSRPTISTLRQRSASLSKFTPSLKGAKQRKGKLKQVSTDRLFVTHQLANQGFDYNVKENSATVFVSPTVHNVIGNAKALTMRDIVEYNSRNQSKVNRRIVDPPLIFPTTSEEVELLQKEYHASYDLFQQELQKQLNNILINNFHITLNIL